MNHSTQGAAVSLAGRINFGKDDLHVLITGGEGLGRYVGINTFYSALAKLDLGVELRIAERQIGSGASDSMRRVQAVARYSF